MDTLSSAQPQPHPQAQTTPNPLTNLPNNGQRTPQVFNTPWPVQAVEPSLRDYFKNTKRLDQYAIIELRLQPREFVQIVVDSQMNWLKQMLITWKKTQAAQGTESNSTVTAAIPATKPTAQTVAPGSAAPQQLAPALANSPATTALIGQNSVGKVVDIPAAEVLEWPKEKLQLRECLDFIAWLQQRSRNFELLAFLGLAPHKSLDKSKFLRVFYLDDIKHSSQHRPLVFALILQILIEQATKLESRLAVIEERSPDSQRRGWVVLTKGRTADTLEALDPLSQFNWKNPADQTSVIRKTLSSLTSTDGNLKTMVMHGDLRILHPESRWNAKDKTFSVFGGDGKELKFAIIGRSPAEKRFSSEQNLYQQASPDQQIPIEIGFHPFWRRLGHTTVRIGESLYELSSHGWKVHSKGADSARAYLFNNPFFKTQYQLFAKAGMPPVSLGATLMIEKAKVEHLQLILENLVAAQGKEKEKFSLMRNNCNQGIMRVFKMADIHGFEDKGYVGFSSILSFRKLLIDSHHPVAGLALYPLPGTDLSEVNVRNWIPRLLYRHNTVPMEMVRAIPSLVWDAVVFFLARVNKFLNKHFKVRIFRGAEPYVMNT